MKYGKLESGKLIYAIDIADTTTISFENGRWVRKTKTPEQMLASGFKVVVDGVNESGGDFITTQYREDATTIYIDKIAGSLTPDEVQAEIDALCIPRKVFLETLAIVSTMRPDITGGAIITKDSLRQVILATPLTEEFTPLAREMSLIALEDMQDFCRGDIFVNGILTGIGFTKEAINNFYQSANPGDLIVGWVKPTV